MRVMVAMHRLLMPDARIVGERIREDLEALCIENIRAFVPP